ncbi:MAG: M23 family metallopeptidase [Novosphingobium sp.]
MTSLAWVGFGLWLWGGRLSAPVQVEPGALFTVHSDAPPSPARTPPPPPAPPTDRLLIPVAGVRADQLVDTFTQARAGGKRVHDAIDIMAPLGTPVLAAAGGRVEKLFISKDGGKTIYVRSPDRRTIHYYAHLDAYAAGLAEGQPVSAGQRIGSVGFSGNANPAAPHLHFAVMATAPDAPWYAKAVALNPYPLLRR